MDQIIKQLEANMSAAITALLEEFAGIRTGRANTLLVEIVMVEAYGQRLPLKQLGAISIVPPRQIAIQIWDPAAIPAVAKSVEESVPGVSANIDGTVIYINLPPLTAERRTELGKFAGKLGEERKIAFRLMRDGANKLAAELKIEDERFKAKEKIQGVIDRANKEVEAMLAAKIKDISE